MKERPNELRIKRLVNGREKQQILAVQSISKNHTEKKRKTQA